MNLYIYIYFFCNNELTLLTTICTPSQSVFCVTLCVNLTTFELWSVYRYQNGSISGQMMLSEINSEVAQSNLFRVPSEFIALSID